MEPIDEPGVLRLVVVFLRFYAGMTQVELAKAAGIHQGYISRYESGQKMPTDEILRRLAAVAAVPWPVVVILSRFFVAVLSATARRAGVGRGAEEPLEGSVLQPALMAVSSYVIEDVEAELGRPSPEKARRDALVLVFLRFYAGLTQVELGKAAGVHQGYISRCESGQKAPSEASLQRMAEAAGVPWPQVVLLRRFYVAILSTPLRQVAVEPDSEKAPECSVLEPALVAVGLYRIEDAAAESGRQSPGEARLEAEEVWKVLEPLPAPRRRWLVEFSLRASRSWALAVRLCEASVRAAADKPGTALELAELALSIAGRVEGEQGWRCRLSAYVWAHIANARRVANDFAGADEAFTRAWELWRAGAACEPDLLPEWRMLDLEASLRKEQQRFPEALALLDAALAAAQGSKAAAGRILLNREVVLEQMGDIEGAIAALAEAAPLVEASGDARLLFALRFEAARNLCHLERYAEASELLPKVRELAVGLGNELDLLRVVWLATRVAAGEGRREEAIAGLEQVRREFTVHELPYEAARSSLELAVLHLEEGRTGEVKILALEMAPIFKAKGITREAHAALKLFCDAAQQETATVELARRIIAEIERERRSAPRHENARRGRA